MSLPNGLNSRQYRSSMSEGSGDGGTAETLLAEGEQALVRGDSAAAFQLLERATHAGIAQGQLHQLATAFAMAARLQNKHADVLAWIETATPGSGRRCCAPGSRSAASST
jgi:hypothetical protein